MKTMKYLLMGVLMLGFSTQGFAQNDKAVIDEATNIIKNSGADAFNQLKPIQKANKKNAAIMVGIGRAFLNAKDTVNAQKYAKYAFEAKNGIENADAHILQADIYVIKDEGGMASQEYEQAILFNKKAGKLDPTPYRKFAQINSKFPDVSAQKLNELRDLLPENEKYTVDLITARIYNNAGNQPKKAIEYYGKLDLNKEKVEPNDICQYALTYFDEPFHNYEKSLEIANIGNKRFPRYLPLNRTTLYNLVALGKFAEATEYVDRLFNKSDSTNYIINDFITSANAYLGNKQYDEALDMFKKAQDFKGVSAANRLAAIKGMSDVHEAKNDYLQAIATYKDYLAGLRNENLPVKVDALDKLGKMHRNYAADLTGEEQAKRLQEAADVYADIIKQFPANADYAHFMKAGIMANLDPELKTGLAYEDYKRVVEIVEAAANKDETDKSRLNKAYSYLFNYYYILKNDKENARIYLQKLIDFNPNNQDLKNMMDELNK